MTPKLKLYGHPLSSCTRKVLMTLAEKNERAELTTVDLFSHEHKSESHLARHPFGVIPVLDDDGFRLYESRAIMRYVDARFPMRSLTPTDTRTRARMDQWLSVDQSYVAPHTRSLAVERVLKKHEGREADGAITSAAEASLGGALAVFDRALRSSRWLAGEELSLADISLLPYVASLTMIGADHLLIPLENLRAWRDRMLARESWKTATESPS